MPPDGCRGAWVAFNTYCRRKLTRVCIQQEVEAGAAILKANTQDGGPTVSSRVCLLVMSRDMDSVQWKRCMDVVGNEQASDEVILTCATAIQWHSQKEGALAGRKIRKCFEKGG